MEDDIDIEEHDVLDNPRIRNIFPDITQIKEEIPDDNYNDPQQEMEYEPYSTDDHLSQQSEEDTSESTGFGNKIILGSKPNSNSILESVLTFGRKSVEVKQEVEEYDETVEEELHEEHYSQPSTVLILGSKPSRSGVITPFSVNNVHREDTEHHNVISFLGQEVDLNEIDQNEEEEEREVNNTKEQRDPSAAVVLVENWGPRLENSFCYCKECQILFPTSNTLLAHNMTAHSFLVALDKNKAVKSTSKLNAKKVETGKLCNHCNKMFPDSDTLINHLYMTFDKNAFKNQPKKVVANPFNKQVSANLAKVQKRDVSRSSKPVSEVQVYAQGATDLFRCEVCSYYCEMYKVFVKHMRYNHSKDTFSQKKEIFDGKCPHCYNVLKSKLVYNRHLQSVHGNFFNLDASEDDLLYRCDICSYYLEVDWALVRHMKHDHGKKFSLKCIKQKKTTFDGKCLHCSSVFAAKRNYNKHMKKVHNNLVKLKGNSPPNKGQIDKTPTPKKIPVVRESNNLANKIIPAILKYNSFTFQCQKCGETFASYGRAQRHRRVKHPELKTLAIFKKITKFGKTASVQKARVPTKLVLKYPKKSSIDKKDDVKNQLDILPGTSKSPQKNNHPDSISKPGNQIVIPKSIIFKCDKCDVHFTSCTATVLHSKSCGEKTDDWKCNICNRLFQKFDQTVHIRQHQVSEKFNVIVFHENIYGRILNRCPNCKLYFHEKEFYLHDQKKFCRGTGVKCEKCSTPIHITSFETHNKWHERIKHIKKNMVRVEFSSITIENTPSTPAKRVLDMHDNAAPPMPAKKAKIEKPQTEKKQIVKYCKKCGIYMFNSVRTSHISGKCKHINLSYKKICKICGLTYTKDTHLMFHKTFPNLTLMDMSFQSVEGKALIAPPIPNFPGCNKCKVHFCKKDAVATHNCKDSYKTCRYCKKRYSDLAYKLHMKFHEYHAKFEASKSLVGISSNEAPVPQKSAKDPMPELLKKYELLTNTWNILFSCSSCDIVCDSYDRVVEHCQQHFNNMESYDMMIQYCEICKLKFDGSCFERHTALHAQNECVNIESFIVCSYQYRNLLKMNWLDNFNRVIPATQMQQILSKSIYTSTGRGIKMRVVQEGPPENTIYRCGQCELYIHPQAITTHFGAVSCNKSSSQKHKCRYCGILFCTYSAKTYHEKRHKTAKSFNVVYLNENGDKEYNEKLLESEQFCRNYGLNQEKGFQYYRCKKCKCCLINRDKTLLHNCSKATSIERCKICQLHFTRKVISKHMRLHKNNPRLTPKNINFIVFEKGPDGIVKFTDGENEKMIIKLYRCQCGLHFTSTKAIERHFETCSVNDDDVIKEKCSKCKRLFDTNQLVAHLCKHHSKESDENTEFEITVMSPGDSTRTKITTPKAENNGGINKSDKRKDLFKCEKCNVYYLSQGGLAYHFEKNHQVFKVTKCPFCKLQFMPMTLQKHILIHHKILRCKVTDFIIYIGSQHKGTLRVEKSVLSPKRSPCKKTEAKHVSANHNVDLSIYNNKLYKCELCDMHLLTFGSLRSHRQRNTHGSELVKCPDCEYSFSSYSLPKHNYIHHKKMKLKREEFKIIYARKGISSVDHSIDDETDCNESNQSLEEAKNLSYDDENDNSVKNSASLQKNENLDHHTSIDMKKEDFEVIESRELLEKELASTSNAEIANTNVETLDDSQTNIVQKIEPTLYKCNGCKQHFLHSRTLNSHLLRSSSQKCPVRETCKYCGLYFSHLSLLKHEKHHRIQKLNLEDFRVIDQVEAGFNELSCSFPNKEDEDESEISEKDTSIETTRDKEAFDTDNNDILENKCTGQVKNKLYQCDKCECCFLTFTNVRDHYAVCQYVQTYAECEKCQLKFHKSLNMHMKHHHETQNLKLKDLVIIRYSPNNFTTPVECLSPLKLIETLETVSTLDNKLYTNDLFKCGTCSLHFLTKESLELHTENPELRLQKSTCTFCGLTFSVNTLPTHVYIHHEDMKLTTADFCLTVKDEIMDEKEDCNILSESVTREKSKELLTINNHNSCDKENNKSRNYVCEPDAEVIELRYSTSSPDTALDNESSSASANDSSENVELVSCDDNQQGVSNTKTDVVKETEMSKTVKLYKCAVCNVCFLTQSSCYRHTVKHIALDPKDYIECKLCGYQFLILNNCLHKHVTKHHKIPFKPEEVLIEEYHPNVLCHGTPKINIYFGTDKLQSKLISTTCGVNISSESSENGKVELTNPDNSSIDLGMDVIADVATANNVESGVKTTDKSTILDMDINSDVANLSSADKVVNNSGNSSIDIDLYKDENSLVSLDITDKSVDGSNNSIIDSDLDKSSDVIFIESGDEDKTT